MEFSQIEKAKRKAQVYALVMWNDYTLEDAIQMAKSMPYASLDKITHVDSMIEHISVEIMNNMGVFIGGNEKEKSDTIIRILNNVHDKWVSENAEQYSIGQKYKLDSLICRHLPFALQGKLFSHEVGFAKPFFDMVGVYVGEVKDSSEVVPSNAIYNAYNRFVEKYIADNHIYNDSLTSHIRTVISTYDALKGNGNFQNERRDYMYSRLENISAFVEKWNEYAFGNVGNIEMKQVVDGLKFIVENKDRNWQYIKNGLKDIGCNFSLKDYEKVHEICSEGSNLDLPPSRRLFAKIFAPTNLEKGVNIIANILNSEQYFIDKKYELLGQNYDSSIYDLVREVTHDNNYTKENIEKKDNRYDYNE